MYMTQYSEFIKDWAQRNNKSYMCAATDPRAREEYYGSYPKRPTKSKLKQNREKQSAAVMGLMEAGAKAKESAAAKDESMSMGGEDVNRGKKSAAPPERNSDLARFNESQTNPAAGVLTNPDLVRMIGSFTKGMKKPFTATASDFFITFESKAIVLRNTRMDSNYKKFLAPYADVKFNEPIVLKFFSSKGISVGRGNYTILEQYYELIKILSRVMFNFKPETIYEPIGRSEEDKVKDLARQEESKSKHFGIEMRKVIDILLSGVVPSSFNYDSFWSIINTYLSPHMTIATNVNMKKLFSNWKNKGKKDKYEDIRSRRRDPDPYMGN